MSKSWLLALFLVFSSVPIALVAGECIGAVEMGTAAGGCDGQGGNSAAGALFIYRGEQISPSDLDLNTRQALYELEINHYEDRQRVIDNALWQIYLAREARHLDKSEEQLLRELIDVRSPSESELRAFYDANKDRIGAPYENIKQQIGRYMLEQQMLAQRDSLVAEIKASAAYESLLLRPSPPVAVIDTEGFPSKGETLAPVEVVEFADYQCPHCKTASQTMKRLKARFGDKIRLVFMDFPINRSGISRRVAEGAVCAGEQGEYWTYHDTAFSQQTSLSHDSPLSIAKSLGLDEDRFAACLSGEQARQNVVRAESEARRLGLNSTPTFFVNGIKVPVHNDMEQELSEAVEQALAAAGTQ